MLSSFDLHCITVKDPAASMPSRRPRRCPHGKQRYICGECRGTAKPPKPNAPSVEHANASPTAGAAATALSAPLASQQRTSGHARKTVSYARPLDADNDGLYPSSPGVKRTAAAIACSDGAPDGGPGTAAAAAVKKAKRGAASVVVKTEPQEDAAALARTCNEATEATAARLLARVAVDPAAVRSRGASLAHALRDLERSGDSGAATAVTGQLVAALGSAEEQAPRTLSVADQQYDGGPFAGLPPLPSSSSLSSSTAPPWSGRATRADDDDDDDGPFGGFDIASVTRRLRIPPATRPSRGDAEDEHNRPRAIEVAPNTHVEVRMMIKSR